MMLNFPSFYLTFSKIWYEVPPNLLILKNYCMFPFFKIFYTLIVHYDNDDYVINFVFSIGKQPYRDVINFLSYIHVVYSYNDIIVCYKIRHEA